MIKFYFKYLINMYFIYKITMPDPFTYELLLRILLTLFTYRFWPLPERANTQCPLRTLRGLSQNACRSPTVRLLSPKYRGLTNGQSRTSGKGPWPT